MIEKQKYHNINKFNNRQKMYGIIQAQFKNLNNMINRIKKISDYLK